MDFVWLILIGILAGWLAGKIMRGRGFGRSGNARVVILLLLLRQ